MRIITQGSRGQAYKNLKKRLNAKTKDEIIVKLHAENWKTLERAKKAEIKLEKLEKYLDFKTKEIETIRKKTGI